MSTCEYMQLQNHLQVQQTQAEYLSGPEYRIQRMLLVFCLQLVPVKLDVGVTGYGVGGLTFSTARTLVCFQINGNLPSRILQHRILHAAMHLAAAHNLAISSWDNCQAL